MRAILTKYLRSTANRGARVKASAEGVKSIIVRADGSWSHLATSSHIAAAVELAKAHDWLPEGRSLRSGTLPNGDMCHVLPSRSSGKTVDRAALHRLIVAANRVAEIFDHCPDDDTAAEAGLELERAAAAIGE